MSAPIIARPMTRIGKLLRGSFGSALLGGLVAVALGVVAIATGVIAVDNTSGSPSAAIVPSQPAAASRSIGDVYDDDAQGVAFIEAEQESSAERRPGAAAPRPAPGS